MTPDAHTLAHDHEPAPWDRGLAADLDVMLSRTIARRRALSLFAGAAGAALLVACGSDGNAGGTSTSSTTGTTPSAGGDTTTGATTAATTAGTNAGTTATDCPTPIPEETAGPYPGDGSNGPDALSDPGVVRSDITTSFGDFTGTAEGVPVTVHLTVLDAAKGCAPMQGGAVYLWHADRDGHYSMYTAAQANYLRGVGEADDTGTVTFQSIFPGCYDGRWPHMHFEIYPSVDDALAASGKIVTTQLALPKDACDVTYTADGYAASITALSHTSLASDMVFGDGSDQQVATVTGSIADGFEVALVLSV